jgi:adenylate cyclase
MSTPDLRHRLLAIMEADGVGYSRLMSIDERATVVALDAAREVFRRHIAAQGGRVLDTAGDSVLAVFETATGAVTAGLAIQQELAEARAGLPDDLCLRFRIGVHLGDVFEKADGTVYGDGVNIAARLEGLATPGGVAVSQSVQTAVQGRVAASFEDIGEQAVKNIAQPVRVFRLHVGSAPESRPPGSAAAPQRQRPRARSLAALGLLATAMLAIGATVWRPWQRMGSPAPVAADASAGTALAAQKTLAVLPFANLGDDKANEYFADGVSDELLNILSRVPGLRVTARNSAFYFKGKTVPVAEMGRQLGVSYLVDGSARKAGERVRVGAQLVNVADGAVLWSSSFDRDLKDVLAAQGDLALQIAKHLRVTLDASSLVGSGTNSAQAWQLFLQGQRMALGQREDFYRRALELDPQFARVHAALALEVFRQANRQATPPDSRDVHARASAHANEALRIDPRSVQAHVMLAYAASWIDDFEAFKRNAERVMQLNPNEPDAYELAAELYLCEGRMDESLAARKRVTELDPLEPIGQSNYASTLAAANRPAQALMEVERAIAIDPDDHRFAGNKAAILMDLGRHAEALALARQVAAKDPPGPLSVLARLGSDQDRAALERQVTKPRDRAYLDLYLGRTEAFLGWLDTSNANFATRGRTLFNPALDPVRNSPAFKALLEKHKLTEAHDRAQAWRAANPPPRLASR